MSLGSDRMRRLNFGVFDVVANHKRRSSELVQTLKLVLSYTGKTI